MKRFKYITCIIPVMIVMLLSACARTTVDFGDQQVVQIICEARKGSGVIYDVSDEGLIIVTAAHVVEGAEQVKIVWNIQSGQTVEAEEIFRVQGLDLAFLKIDEGMASGSICTNIPREDHVSSDNIPSMLKYHGFDAQGNQLELPGEVFEYWIYVEDFGCHMMLGKCTAEAGMSGGAAWVDEEVFAGIICGMDEHNNVAILPAAVIGSEYSVLEWQK